MKTVQLLLSGLFLLGIILSAQGAAKSIASSVIAEKGRMISVFGKR
jgi:hypothetical protein